MAGARDIKRKIGSVTNTMQITKAMELVSTAKLKKTRDRVDLTKPYFETVVGAVQDIISSERSLKHEYINKRDVKKTLYIVVSADRGLCGGYNSNAIKKVVNQVEDPSKAVLITIGKKAGDAFERMGFEILKKYLYISEKPEYSDAQDIARVALKMYAEEKVDEIKLIYTRLESTISQVATELKLLPVEPRAEEESAGKEGADFEYVSYEPSPEYVLSFIIPKYLESTVYGGLVESAASEQAARRMAMESATDNAEDMIDKLTLSYNQARQAAITQEISEIVGGAEALK
jgi:F-type H+-transporting ATPase subunit gamma